RDLHREAERLAERQPPVAEPIAQRLSFEELHDDVGRARVAADVVDGEDVGMVEVTGGEGLLLEAAELVGRGRIGRAQQLERYGAREPRVEGLVDVTHRARAEERNDL